MDSNLALRRKPAPVLRGKPGRLDAERALEETATTKRLRIRTWHSREILQSGLEQIEKNNGVIEVGAVGLGDRGDRCASRWGRSRPPPSVFSRGSFPLHCGVVKSPEGFLEVRDLTIRYASRPGNALNAVNLAVAREGSLAVLGDSGAGKSTLGKAMLGLLAPGVAARGEVLFDGVDMLSAAAERVRAIRGKRIAILGQDPAQAFHPQRRVGPQIAEMWSRDHARDALAAVELGEARFFDSYPHELSGGQLQRAALAMALCREPELLVADEPASALDTVTQAAILRLLVKLRVERRLALVFITHDPRLLPAVAERAVVLREGRVVEEGPVDEVLRRPRHSFTRELVECAAGAGWR